MSQNINIPESIIVLFPQSYSPTDGKIPVIKTIRALTGCGLKEAKDMSEVHDRRQHLSLKYGSHILYPEPLLQLRQIDESCRLLKLHGCDVTPTIDRILQDLRKSASDALNYGDDDLANQILQIVLVQKLKRGI